VKYTIIKKKLWLFEVKIFGQIKVVGAYVSRYYGRVHEPISSIWNVECYKHCKNAKRK
jgi:hypothetical protein